MRKNKQTGFRRPTKPASQSREPLQLDRNITKGCVRRDSMLSMYSARDERAAKLATTEGIRILGSRIAAVKFRDGIEQPSNHKGRGSRKRARAESRVAA